MPKLRLDCLMCGETFERWPSAAGKYCSRKCYEGRPALFDMAAWQEVNRLSQNQKKLAWSRANREKKLAIQKKWRLANKARIATLSKTRRRIYSDGATPSDVAAVMSAAEGRCTYCDQLTDRLELDHVDPVAWGSPHSISNLLPACRTCNASKSDRPVEDWLLEKHGVIGLIRAVYMLENRHRLEASSCHS